MDMLIIGERINATRKNIKKAILSHDANAILKEAKAQLASGAHYVDINCATGVGDEPRDMEWAISVIQSELMDANICIDSPNHLAIERALAAYKGRGDIMINSITGEETRMGKILPLVKARKTKVVALTMGDRTVPTTARERYEAAKKIFDRVRQTGIPEEDIYFDPLIRPIAVEPTQAREFLKAIPMIKGLGKVKTVCGISNISFGLPKRSIINSIFLSMAMQAGLDAVIMDPLDKNVTSGLKAAKAILCMDEYCADYIKAFREGVLI